MISAEYQPHSQLTYRQSEPRESASLPAGTIITLHGHMRTMEELMPLAAHAAPENHVVAPEAARGVYRSILMIGKTWFGGSLEKPEAASFGDSLAQIERFIYDAQARAGDVAPKPWLLGYEQGAVLASTVALIAPVLISGIIAIDGGLPLFSNEDLLEPMEANLPILYITDSTQGERATHIETSAKRLKDLGNQVKLQSMPVSIDADSPVAQAAKIFLDAHGQSS